MKSQNFNVVRYEADEGKVFDWIKPSFQEDENGEKTQEHLYVKVLFIGSHDSIDNYVEVDEVVE